MKLPDIRRANKAQAAEFFGVSLPTVESWIRKGAPVVERGARGVSWTLDLRAVAEWVYGSQSAPGRQDPDTMTPQDRKAWYDAEERKRALQVKDGELCVRAEVEQAVVTAFAAIKQDILAIPDLLERTHGVAPEVAEAVERALYEALEGLAEDIGRLAPVEAPA